MSENTMAKHTVVPEPREAEQSAAEPEIPIIEMLDGMPGFPAARQFALMSVDEMGMLYRFQSLQDPDLRFLVVPPAPFFPQYEPEIDDESANRLDLSTAEDALLLLVITVTDTPQDATANLFAPIVINTKNKHAAQVVLTGSDLPIRAALYSG